MSNILSNKFNHPTSKEQGPSPASTFTFGGNPFYPNGVSNNTGPRPVFGSAPCSLASGSTASSTATAPAFTFRGATASNTGPAPAFGTATSTVRSPAFGSTASSTTSAPASSLRPPPYGSTEHSRQGTTPTIGKLSPSQYLTIKEEETSNECLVCEKVFDKIVPNGVCDSEDCQYKYNMDTCYECGTELLASDQYKKRDGDEDVCKACWDGTTNEVTCEACCRTLSDQGTIYNEREIYPEEET